MATNLSTSFQRGLEVRFERLKAYASRVNVQVHLLDTNSDNVWERCETLQKNINSIKDAIAREYYH